MIAVWVAVYVLAGIGCGGLLVLAVVLALIVRDTRRVARERGGRRLRWRERRALREMERRAGGGS